MLRRRALVALTAGAGIAVVAAEGALRIRYPDAPPSLHALAAADPDSLGTRETRSLVGCTEGRIDGALHPAPQVGPERGYLYVVGDSVAAGWGVEKRESFAAVLGADLAAAEGREVTVVNDSNPGGSLCELAARAQARARAERRPPDWAVLAVFADDLDQHGAMYVNGQLVAWPESGLPPSVAPLFRASWLLNLAWYAAVSRSPERLDAALPPDERAMFVRSMHEVEGRYTATGTRHVWVLLAPSGQAACPADAPEGTWCRRLTDGAASLRALFRGAEIPLVDLTGLWGGTLDYVQEKEAGAMPPLNVPIHPNPAGHALLARTILPLLEPPKP